MCLSQGQVMSKVYLSESQLYLSRTIGQRFWRTLLYLNKAVHVAGSLASLLLTQSHCHVTEPCSELTYSFKVSLAWVAAKEYLVPLGKGSAPSSPFEPSSPTIFLHSPVFVSPDLSSLSTNPVLLIF